MLKTIPLDQYSPRYVLKKTFIIDQYLRKPRDKIQIYYDILNGINLESNNGGGARPTRVQIHSNLAYDKLAKYLNELEMKEMILKNPLRITEKGRDYFAKLLV